MRKFFSIILISLIIILNILPPINSFATEIQSTQQEQTTEDKSESSQSSSDKYGYQTAPDVEKEGLKDYNSIIKNGEATHERKDRNNKRKCRYY